MKYTMQNLDQIFHLSKDHMNFANIWALSFIFPKITRTVPISGKFLSSFQRSLELCQYLGNIFHLSEDHKNCANFLIKSFLFQKITWNCASICTKSFHSHELCQYMNNIFHLSKDHMICANIWTISFLCLIVFLNHHKECPGVRHYTVS